MSASCSGLLQKCARYLGMMRLCGSLYVTHTHGIVVTLIVKHQANATTASDPPKQQPAQRIHNTQIDINTQHQTDIHRDGQQDGRIREEKSEFNTDEATRDGARNSSLIYTIYIHTAAFFSPTIATFVRLL